MERAWGKLYTTLQTAKSRWGRARGPISAIICTLLDLGWSPETPSHWVDPDGEAFNLDEDDLDKLIDFELHGSLDQAAWERAEGHHLGGGIGRGVDLTVPRRFLQTLRRNSKHAEAAMAQMVLTGSLWPASRRFGGLEGRPLEALQASQAQVATEGPQDGPQNDTEAQTAEHDQEERQEDQDAARGEGGAASMGAGPLSSQHRGIGAEPPDRSILCPRCGLEKETTFHQLWACPANEAIPGVHLELLPEAREHHSDAPFFWLRGLPPLHWTYTYCMRPVRTQASFTGCSPAEPIELPVGAVVGTDGSGGPFGSEPRLRRCGWGFSVVLPGPVLLAGGAGPLDYWKQTVPLSELVAATAALLCTVGDVEFVIDNADVVAGIRAGPYHKHKTNRHAWRVFWHTAGDRRLTAHKVKSHLTEEEATEAGVEPLLWYANASADRLAEQAAQAAQPSQEDAAAVQAADRKAALVLEHLTAVAFHVAQDARHLYGPANRLERAREARERAEARKGRLETALSNTTHQWCGTKSKCLTCFLGPTKDQPKEAFLLTACTGRPHQIHDSHSLKRHRELWFCSVCGCTGSRRLAARGLGGPCHPASDSGRRTLLRLQAGRLPYHVKAWPDEGAEAAFGLELVD